MTTHTLTVNGMQLNVSIRGQGSPLLLLNGLGGLIPAFNPLRDELPDYQTITLDVPGVGASQTPRWPMRLPAHADLIADLLTQLEIDQLDVFGVSWGGTLAQELALRHPSRVRRLILAATSTGPAMWVKPADIVSFFGGGSSAKRRKREGSPDSIQSLLRFGVGNGMLTGDPRAYLHQLAALVGWTSLMRLWRLRQPTLILTGERDTLVLPYNGHVLRRSIRRAELQVLQGEGHLFMVTSAELTAEAIRDFFGRTNHQAARHV
ncbi:pimeloyl-ACP methyl ester carboxylesterase [Pseudomonas sp. TE3610]